MKSFLSALCDPRSVVRISAAVAVLLASSGCGPGGGSTFLGGSKIATEDRDITPPEYVDGAGIEVRTPAGCVDIAADRALKQISIAAKVSAFGETDKEAKGRLQDVKVKVSRRADNVLEIAADLPNLNHAIKGNCSFVVRVPGAKGVKIQTGNGTVTIKGLEGSADLDSGVGSITVADQTGNVAANTGNGSISIANVGGDVLARTSVGAINLEDASGGVKAETGNGSVEVKHAGAGVDVTASVGSITIAGAAGAVTASSGNGGITVSGSSGLKAKTSVGDIRIEKAGGAIEAESGNGSIVLQTSPDSDPSFKLDTSVGSVSVHLPAVATGRIDAKTSVGAVAVNGARKPVSIIGKKNETAAKTIVLKETGPESIIRSGNGNITITLD